MLDKLERAKIDFLDEISKASSLKDLEELRIKYTGRSGIVPKIMKGMKDLPNDQKPVVGNAANELSTIIKENIDDKTRQIEEIQLEKRLEEEKIDVSLNKDLLRLGHPHPLIKTMEDLEDLFVSMGFRVIDGPEIESVANNFDLLNSPSDHPSRDMSDTFYFDEKTLLRTHTSPVQIRAMKEYGAPLKMISTGRTFRYDAVDATHSPMFHQMEGLVVGEDISMANLIATLDIFIKEFFGDDIETRYRPHDFPFTEPSIEVDVTCFSCHGKGCASCGHTGWSMELLGGGMVHPKVLENCNIDPEKYSGFAFGLGIDRVAMVKYGIDDIRLLFENDNRFLGQF